MQHLSATKLIRQRGLSARTLAWGLLITLFCGQSALAAQLYRYTNAAGGTEIGSSVPNELVVNGYQVIDSSSGRVIRTVAAQLSPAEAKLKKARDRLVRQCLDTQRRVNSLYQDEADIDHAEAQALESINTRILNAQAGLTQLRNQQEDLEDQAARLERTGHGVTSVLVGNIDRAKTQIASLELEILARRVEQEDARKQFDADRDVFRQGNCVEKAKRMITPESLAQLGG